MTEVQTSQYWISPTALYISLNAMGNPDYVQANVASGASILCYVPGIEGLGYDNGHNYKRWQLLVAPTYFEDASEKYVYVAIPKDSSVSIAPIVFPSEHIDVYGKNEAGEQIGSEAYYYVWIRGVISAPVEDNGVLQRKWTQSVIYGSLSTDEALNAGGADSWWQYSSVDNTVKFTKDISDATFLSAKIHNLIFGQKVINGIAEHGVTFDDAEDKIVTPAFLTKYGGNFLSRVHEDTAQKAITFMEGLRLGAADSGYSIGADGRAVLGDVVVDRVHDAKSTEKDRVIIGTQGFDLYIGEDGKSHLYIDHLVTRVRAYFAELEIRRVSYAGGTTILSNAGSTIQKVEVLTWTDGAVAAYKCWAVADDGTTRTANWWKPGMMALSQTFNVAKTGTTTNTGNRRYWRLVVDAGQETLDDGKVYDYVVLSNVKEFGGDDTVIPMDGWMSSLSGVANARLDITKDDGGTAIGSRMFYGYEPTEAGGEPDVPMVGDVIVQVGDELRWNTNGNVIVMRTSTEGDTTATAPSVSMYHGIGALRGTGVTGTDGVETASVWQWKQLTCVLSPELVLMNTENFKWFSGSVDNIIDPVAVWYEILTTGGEVITRKADGTVSPDFVYVSVRKHEGAAVKLMKGFELSVTETLDGGSTKYSTLQANATEDSAVYQTRKDASSVLIKYGTGDTAVQKSLVVVKDGAKGDDGTALEISVEPGTLTFQTKEDEKGNVVADCSTGNTAQIKVMRGSDDITLQCGYLVRSADGYTGMKGGDGCTATVKSDGVVTITAVSTTSVDGRNISLTNASVTVRVTDGAFHYVTIPVQVSVSAVWGSLVANQKKFETQYSEITGRLGDVEDGVSDLPLKTEDDLVKYTSLITQTARSIALKVGQTLVGRRNLFVGSALRKRGEGADISSVNGSGIAWDGYDGANAFRAVVKYVDGDDQQYPMVDNGTVTEGGASENIRLPKKGTKYTLSCRVKGEAGLTFGMEAFWKATATDGRSGQKGGMGAMSQVVTEDMVGTWQLLTLTVDVPKDAQYDYMEVCAWATHTEAGVTKTGYISEVMVAEGDEYDGYTLAEKDYAYIGGNMLDGTRALTVVNGDNLDYVNDVAANGYGGCAVVHASETTGADGAYTEVAQWAPTLKQGEDYTLQFIAKGTGVVPCYMYGGTGDDQRVWVDKGDDTVKASGYMAADGYAPTKLTAEWRMYKVHWRVVGSTVPKWVLIRCSSGSEVWVAQPKLEAGATATDWTDSKTSYTEDRAMGAKMLETGIDIENQKMTLTADKTLFRTNAGKEVAVFDASGLNAELVRAKRLETASMGGASVRIENGMIEVLGTNGVANIRFGVNDEGLAVMSYYDAQGKWLYDLGPSKLDSGTLKNSSMERIDIGFWTADEIGKLTEFTVDGESYGLLVAVGDINTKLFGGGLNSQPLAKTGTVLMLYRYTAGRLQNTIVKDEKRNLTAALAKEADGRYFTSETISDGTSLKNLATGKFFRVSERVDEAPQALTTTDTAYTWPRYSMRYLDLENGQMGMSSVYGAGLLYSRATQTIQNGDIIMTSELGEE